MTTSDINSELGAIIHKAQEEMLQVFNDRTAEHDPPSLPHSDIYAALAYFVYLAENPDATQKEVREQFGEFTYNTLTKLRDFIPTTWLLTPPPPPSTSPITEPEQDPLARAIQIGHEFHAIEQAIMELNIHYSNQGFPSRFIESAEFRVLNTRREELREELWRNL